MTSATEQGGHPGPDGACNNNNKKHSNDILQANIEKSLSTLDEVYVPFFSAIADRYYLPIYNL